MIVKSTSKLDEHRTSPVNSNNPWEQSSNLQEQWEGSKCRLMIMMLRIASRIDVCQRTWSNNKEQWVGPKDNDGFGQTWHHEANTKMHAPSNNDSKPQAHIKSNRKHLNETSDSKNANEHGKQCKLQANCNTDSYATKHPKAQGMSRGCRGDRGDAEQAVATSRRHRKP